MASKSLRAWKCGIAWAPRLAMLALILMTNACGSGSPSSNRSKDAGGGDGRSQGAEVLTGGDARKQWLDGSVDWVAQSDLGTTGIDVLTGGDARNQPLDGPVDWVAQPDLGTTGFDTLVPGSEAGTPARDTLALDTPQLNSDTGSSTDLMVGPPDASFPKLDALDAARVGDAREPDTVLMTVPDASPDTTPANPDTSSPDTEVPDTPIADAQGPPTDTAILAPLPRSTGSGTFAIAGRENSEIEVVVPSNLGPNPPLVFSFHGTGGSSFDGVSQFQLGSKAVTHGFIVIAPQAGYRDGQHPADVDHAQNQGDSSWNMWDMNPATNEDLRYLVALIEAARQTYGIDTSRVYTMGFSNGAFFSYFAAVSLPNYIAGFAEDGGGWMTDACPTRYLEPSYVATDPPAGYDIGATFPCSVVFASADFSPACRISATNHLRPPAFGSRIPFGFMGHYTSDSVVSAQWSCLLAEALGNRGQTSIRFADTTGGGHVEMPDFFDQAWAFLSGRTNTQ